MFILKFWDNVLEQVNQKILQLDLLKNKYDEDFDLSLGTSILKQFWASKYIGPFGG